MFDELERQLSRLRLGEHLCAIYSSQEEQVAASVPFLTSGISRGECCIYIGEGEEAETVSRAMNSRKLNAPVEHERGNLRFLSVKESYYPTERFNVEAILNFLKHAEEAAVNDGCTGLCVAGHMGWAISAGVDSERLIDYEVRLNQYLAGRATKVLCLYNRTHFTPAIIHDVIITHPVVILGSLVCPNPYYEPPELIRMLGMTESEEHKTRSAEWWIQRLTQARTAERERERIQEEHQRAEQELRTSAERLQSLSRQLLRVQEDERRHLARELHDEVGQLLTGLRLLLRPRDPNPAEPVNDRLEQARGVVDELMERVRGLSFDLRPAALDQLGLVPGLLALFERYSDQTGILVDFKHQGLEQRFSPEVETAAYRTVQEALTNVARHAAVAGVTVRLWTSRELLNVQIEDRGRGFDAEEAIRSSRSHGLMGMNERISLLGGRLTVESRPSSGTQILAEIPLTLPGDEP